MTLVGLALGQAVKRPKPRYAWGVLAKYARLVSSASDGAVTG